MPSPTLHRVLVEQILSADDFLIFKVGGYGFFVETWPWQMPGWWFGCHFLFSHILESSQLTNIFQRGSNHQPECWCSWDLNGFERGIAWKFMELNGKSWIWTGNFVGFFTGNSWGLATKTSDFHGFDARLWWVHGGSTTRTTSLLEWRLGLGELCQKSTYFRSVNCCDSYW